MKTKREGIKQEKKKLNELKAQSTEERRNEGMKELKLEKKRRKEKPNKVTKPISAKSIR